MSCAGRPCGSRPTRLRRSGDKPALAHTSTSLPLPDATILLFFLFSPHLADPYLPFPTPSPPPPPPPKKKKRECLDGAAGFLGCGEERAEAGLVAFLAAHMLAPCLSRLEAFGVFSLADLCDAAIVSDDDLRTHVCLDPFQVAKLLRRTPFVRQRRLV